MEYTYKSRRELEDKFVANWGAEHAAEAAKLKGDQKALYDVMWNYKSYAVPGQDIINKVWNDNSHDGTLSQFIKKHFGELVEVFVPQEYIDDYYYMLDKYVQFSYQEGIGRRTARTKNIEPHYHNAFRLMRSYRAMTFYNVSLCSFIKDELGEDKKDFKYNSGYYSAAHVSLFDDMLCARIDAGDKEIIDTIKDAILSENNTVIVSKDIIRAIVKCDSEELVDLLGKFLVAARLQEGVRQAVCENADCGTAKAQLKIFEVIINEDLTRFAAIKRAIAVWTGFCGGGDDERINNKVFELLKEAVFDLDKARQMLKTNDSIQIMTGLWALGFFDIQDAIDAMKEMAKNGTKNQLITISYYNMFLQDRYMTHQVSKEILAQYKDDLDIVMGFMHSYLGNYSTLLRTIMPKGDIYNEIPFEKYFDSLDEVRANFDLLMSIYDSMDKKRIERDPFIFPWHKDELSKGDLVKKLGMLAYILKDNELIEQVCEKLDDMDGQYSPRDQYLRLLLHEPKTAKQRKILITNITNKETYTRKTAFDLVKKLTLTDEEYEQLEEYLRFKTQDIRKNVLSLLEEQAKEKLIKSIERMLGSKNAQIRLGALDIIKSKYENDKENRAEWASLVKDIEGATEQEKVLLEGFSEKGGVTNILDVKGYGLYDPDVTIDTESDNKPEKVGIIKKLLSKTKNADTSVLKRFFSVSKKELDRVALEFVKLIEAHGNDEYKKFNGDTALLCNGITGYHGNGAKLHERYPFSELWKKFYENSIKDEKLFWNIYFALMTNTLSAVNYPKNYDKHMREIFGDAHNYCLPDNKCFGNLMWQHTYRTAIECIESMYEFEVPIDVARECAKYCMSLPEDIRWFTRTGYKSYGMTEAPIINVPFTEISKVHTLISELRSPLNKDGYGQNFFILYELDNLYKVYEHRSSEYTYNTNKYFPFLSIYNYIKAYEFSLISEDMVYKMAFEVLGVTETLKTLSVGMEEKLSIFKLNGIKAFLDGEEFGPDQSFCKLVRMFYTKITDLILDVELKRGDSETVFSSAVRHINVVYGLERLIDTLKALGKDTLDRSTYYYGSSATARKACLSHILQATYPNKDDDVAKLKKLLKESSIKEDRLIEVALYAPQWLDLVEECLGYPGFKSSCYYFMAHMNERFDDKKMAMIAKYTPLSGEELNDGCFDVNWFNEAYNALGEKIFMKIYAAAKYISDGNKHSRARKYADAALGKVNLEEIEKNVSDKRNKDLFMSYGLVPIKDDADLLHRYEYIQRFLKESKQFGAQRRASEAKAVEVALKNMATNAGYADDLRLILAMETAIVTSNGSYFDEQTIGEYQVKIEVDEIGKATTIIKKDGKQLKTIPAAIKKDETFIEIKDFAAKLKQQYSRCVKMFENAMEDREFYGKYELVNLCKNPVIRSILENLVFITKRKEKKPDSVMIGMLSDGDFVDINGEKIKLAKSDELRVAHPFDLYKAGNWADYQKLFFKKYQDENTKQPFKQVFRELYVKLDEENDSTVSRMFAGNQIQPMKTVGALKTRRWVADYESGIQKVYYKDNIIATIYAMADWFSPSDVEAPTLEYVAFYDRKSFKSLKVSEIPDIVYSEVMRDTDLAVSVAHAGGVDPMTSHSTIEMRKVIAKFNVELFKLSNVRFEGTHAFIKGTHGEYSIHLGSGVIHKIGGHQISVLPVHSQSRGKIFLPFIDEDPKSAEIMSKILLFAEDNKIKDPYIMEQLH